MTVTIKVDGEIYGNEKLKGELELPENWKPDFRTFCMVKGMIRYLTEKLAQEFSPPPDTN